ncbi:class I SAM-dependent methyltransferase [Beggiatoa leptomitoformis]|uniref:Ribosomal RNA small subunit methyltransferase J n=1 Tax=Beggiatoa leptomitoformis TaxID=288004 RepID=A0A2N9YBR7_9GAMM|nr:class I SAM-dependent methyltransferase [Beggiatoa leptomitoformis]ALG69290.2 16S rRNA methyltransferase [Beggiatoa leptomitoformis]AUI67913.1 16S rRNA methyltransferase [Beggiatoa leptomitoformis]
MTIAIFPSKLELSTTAAQFAAVFRLPLLNELPDNPNLILHLTENYLELRDFTSKEKGVYVDFVGGRLGYRRQHGGGKNQPLGRAVGLKKGILPRIVDATAGLGRDAFILACLGCQVTMVERSPVIAALLYDGLKRARQNTEIIDIIENISLIHQEACAYLTSLGAEEKPDIIYLDPMYPHRDKSALVKKEMRIFRHLVGNDDDADDLLQTALMVAKQRVVVKRPRHAVFLANKQPTVSIESPNTRFDVYVVTI